MVDPLHISKTMVDRYIFQQTMLFDHFDPSSWLSIRSRSRVQFSLGFYFYFFKHLNFRVGKKIFWVSNG